MTNLKQITHSGEWDMAFSIFPAACNHYTRNNLIFIYPSNANKFKNEILWDSPFK